MDEAAEATRADTDNADGEEERKTEGEPEEENIWCNYRLSFALSKAVSLHEG